MATTSPEREASARGFRIRVVACELVDSEVRLFAVVKNADQDSLGFLVPAGAQPAEAPEFPEFQSAWDAAAPIPDGAGIETRCGPDPRTLLTLEPGQSVTRSVVFPIARWGSRAQTETAVKWRWRQFEVERPWQEVAVSGCSLVQLQVKSGRCQLIRSRPLPCASAVAVDADLERSDAEPSPD